MNPEPSVELKKKKKKKRKYRLIQKEEKSEFELPDVYRIIISKISQKILGCVLYEDVTSEDPWTYVSKETIEDNIELHEESSEFISFSGKIKQYPDDKILVGYIPERSTEEVHEFFMCLSKESEKIILGILERKKLELQERLKNTVEKIPKQWNSLGSENVIDMEIIRNKRPLFEIEIVAKKRYLKPNLKLAPSNRSLDSYTEILKERFPTENIMRLRVDNAVQSSSVFIDKEVQTNFRYRNNAYTQYKYEYPDNMLEKIQKIERKLKGTKASNNVVNDFVTKVVKNEFQDVLEVNSVINIYDNDYNKLKKSNKRFANMDGFIIKQLLTFSDIPTCNNMFEMSLNWSPFMSGLFAASYGYHRNTIVRSFDSGTDNTNNAIYKKFPVLIWSYNEPISPKLYLETHLPVNYLSFCPFDPNILIGGCINGQIILWDITNRIENVEEEVSLNDKQIKSRIVTDALTKWFNNTIDNAHVPATVTSSLEHTVHDMINFIDWISPNDKITQSGQMIHLKKDEPRSMQFMTLDAEGCISFWDLKTTQKSQKSHRVRKLRRLQKQPSGLIKDESRFRSLNKIFKPFFCISVQNKKFDIPLLIADFPRPIYMYEPIESVNADNRFIRKHFNLKHITDVNLEQKMTVTTTLGQILQIKWSGLSFNTGKETNHESAQNIVFKRTHSSPIAKYAIHPFRNNIVLTLCRRYFVLWDKTYIEAPLLYVESNIAYVDAIWSISNPCIFYVIQEQGNLEMWNVAYKTHEPAYIVKVTNRGTLALHNSYNKRHTLNDTFAISDQQGNIGIFCLNEEIEILETTAEMFVEFNNFIDRQKKVHIQTHNWIKRWKTLFCTDIKETSSKKIINKEEEAISQEQGDEPRTARPIIKTQKQLWYEKRENEMYKTLLNRKRIDINELKKMKIPLEKMKKESNKRSDKEVEMYKNKEKVFETARRALLFGEFKQNKMITTGVSLTTSQDFIQEYYDLEAESLKYIKKNQFIHIFNWNKIVEDGLQRYKYLYYADKHYMSNT